MDTHMLFVPLALSSLLLATSAPAKPGKPVIGDTEVFATLPPFPGYPEQPITFRGKLYVCTDAHFGTVGQGPAEVQVFDRRTGDLLERVPLQGDDVMQEHGMSAGAFDREGRLYVNSVQQGVIRIDFRTGHQDLYAPPIPFLPMCPTVPLGVPCSTKQAPMPPLANDILFDEDGTAYITDTFQGIVWSVPRGGGIPEIYFQDPRLTPVPGGFGVNGMRLAPDGRSFYVNVTQDAPTNDGVIYTLRKVRHPIAADLVELHRWTAGTGNPDDLAVGRSGRIYVSQPLQNYISILEPHGHQIETIPTLAQMAGVPVPFDMPSGIDFDDETRSIYVTNHAEYSGIVANMVVFRTFVDDRALPLAHPVIF